MKYLKKIGILSFFTCLVWSNGVSQQEQGIGTEVKDLEDDLSSKELQAFADIYQQVQAKNSEAQQEMLKSVEDEGLSIKRYQKLVNAKKNPDSEITETDREKEMLMSIRESFTEIQSEFKVIITELIENEGMTIERYQEVYQMVRQDKSLQQELGKLMNG